MSINPVSVVTESYNSTRPITIDALPQEILEHIFTFLKASDFHRASSVGNYKWTRASAFAIAKQEFEKIKVFVEFLCEDISNKDTKIKEELHEVLKDKEIVHSVDLREVKASILKIKDKFISILKNLSEADVETIDSYSMCGLISKDITIMIKIYQQADQISRIADKKLKSKKYAEWLDSGDRIYDINHDIIKEILKEILIEDLPDFFGGFICEVAAQGLYDEAYGLLEKVQNLETKEHVRCLILALSGKIDEAFELAQSFRSEQNEIYYSLVHICLKSTNFDKAQQIAKMITNDRQNDVFSFFDNRQNKALSRIVEELALHGKYMEAEQLARLNPAIKNSSLTEISYILAKRDDLENAVRLALESSSEDPLREIHSIFARRGKIAEAIRVAKIRGRNIDGLYSTTAEKLSKKEIFLEATQIASEISNVEQRKETYKFIINHMMYELKYDKVVIFINTITDSDSNIRNEMLSCADSIQTLKLMVQEEMRSASQAFL